MEEKELKELKELIKDEVKKLNEAQETYRKASADERVKIEEKMKKLDENIEKLSNQADQLELKMKDFSLGKAKKGLFDDMKEALTKKETIEMLKKGGQMSFELKASTIDTQTELSGSNLATAVVIPFREAEVGKAPDRVTSLLAVVNKAVTSSGIVTWVERSARTEGAAFVAETAQNPQSDVTYIQRSKTCERIGTHYKVTSAALEDWDQLYSEIVNEVIPQLEREIESNIFSGSGTSPALLGMTANASAFSVSGLTEKVVNPNYLDAIRACVAQLLAANYLGPFTAVINPVDAALMDLAKDSNGAYVIPPFLTADRKLVSGARLIESNLVRAGNVLVGDMSKDTLYFRRGIEVKLWDQDSTDPEYDLKTITASARCLNRIKQVHYNAFVYDAFDDIITSISIPVV